MLHTAQGIGDYVITPGYQPQLYYVAEASGIQNIRLLKKDELWAPSKDRHWPAVLSRDLTRKAFQS